MTESPQKLSKEIALIKRSVLQIKSMLESQQKTVSEDDESHLELADDVVAEIQASRKRKRSEFISHEVVMKQHASG